MHKRVQELAGYRKHIATSCLKTKDGKILMDKQEVIERWTEYVKELYAGDDRPELHTQDQCDGPPILKAEVEDAIQHMKKCKAPGSDNITIEEIKAVGEMGVEVIAKLLNDIYNSGYMQHGMDCKKQEKSCCYDDKMTSMNLCAASSL
ncbi:hypothetical protein BsWGS_08181 [Bradybaena similaris]